MRLIVMYDLPNKSKKESTEYTKFRRHLITNGFYMIQYSIYCRLCINHDALAIYENKIKNNLPKYGNVRIISVTEKQYRDMKILVGSKRIDEEYQDVKRLVVI